MHSLREHWKGQVYCVCEGDQEPDFLRMMAQLGVEPIQIDMISGLQSLCTKPHLYKYSKTELTMFMDSDTHICAPIDKFFEYIAEHEFVTTNFSNWKTDAGGMITRRIKAWAKVCDEKMIQDAIEYGQAINTGVNGWRPDAEILKHWAPLTEEGQRNNCVRRMVDELACQMLIPQYQSFVADSRWNTSVKFDRITRNTKVIHYHGNKHVWPDQFRGCKIWKRKYLSMCREGFLDKNECYGDRLLRRSVWRGK